MSRRSLIAYDPSLKARSRMRRNHPTSREAKLWTGLRRKQLFGYSFYRQRPLDGYIVDCYCPELGLVIEVDGMSHVDRLEADLRRQRKLAAHGLQFLRFNHQEVMQDYEQVMRTIIFWIERVMLSGTSP